MLVAKFLEKLDWVSDSRLYSLSSPLKGHNYIIVSSSEGQIPDTAIYGADKYGNPLDFEDLPGSYTGTSHMEALRRAGYILFINE